MKRIFLLIMLPVAMFLSSCQKTVVKPNQTIIIDLPSSAWDTFNDANSYTAKINIPRLDDYMNEQGGVLVYLSFGDRAYEQIPQVYNRDSYTFITRPGQIVLELQQLGGLGTVTRPITTTVKIVLIDSGS